MYERATIALPFPPASTITREMVQEMLSLEDFQITYSDKEITWTELAVKNLEYMIDIALSYGSDPTQMQMQKAQLQSIIDKRAA